MKLKTEQELQANYDRFIGIIKKYFTGERLEKLLFMYSEHELGVNLVISPASCDAFGDDDAPAIDAPISDIKLIRFFAIVAIAQMLFIENNEGIELADS